VGNIDVGDRVQIIKTSQENKKQLLKFGQLILLADGTNCVVALDDGSVATVDIGVLKKIQ
jgi:hypothetical protein